MDSSIHIKSRQYTITELIPLEKLQRIQDSFAIANEVASTITDPEGIPITQPSNYCAVCTMVRNTQKGLANCVASGKQLGIMACEKQHPVSKECFSIGFTDAVAPIVVHDIHIANWIMGQYCTNNVDEQRIEKYAREIGADPQEMKNAFKTMPTISKEAFGKKLSFLEIMAHELSMMGYLHLQQKEQATELEQIKTRLEEQQSQLEYKVLERTKELQDTNDKLQIEISKKSKIQKRRDRLITAIESAAESIVITSTRGRIIYVNPAFEKLTGYSRKEAIGNTPSILQSGYHDESFYKDIWQTIRSGHTWSGRFINKKKDNTLYHEDSTISPVFDTTGKKILSYVAVKKDVTKEQQLQTQLKQAQRLEAIGTLAAGMAHEINTPIQYILSNTYFLQDAVQDFAAIQNLYQQLTEAAAQTLPTQAAEITAMAKDIDLDFLLSESQEALQQSLEGLNKVADIVKTMKEFADPGDTTSRQRENLNSLIRSATDISQNVWNNVAELHLSLDDSIPEVLVYSSKVKQIIMDMIINSSHALIEKYGMHPEEKGSITISTQLLENDVVMHITDSGAGIPKVMIPRIFDPFFSTKTVGQGEGQSLAVAHRVIVEEHGGSIEVDSTPQIGTTFIIRFPT